MSSCVCKISFKSVQVCGGCCKMFRGLTFLGHSVVRRPTMAHWHSQNGFNLLPLPPNIATIPWSEMNDPISLLRQPVYNPEEGIQTCKCKPTGCLMSRSYIISVYFWHGRTVLPASAAPVRIYLYYATPTASKRCFIAEADTNRNM